MSTPAEHPHKDFIELRVDGAIAEVVINRPEKRNALNREMWAQIPTLMKTIDEDDRIRAVIVRGEGPAFSAGADIAEFETARATREAARLYEETTTATDAAIADCTKPTIAAIEGACVGGGLEIALACDFRIAGDGVRFGITPARIGLVYGFSATQRLVQTTGMTFAKRLLFTGDLMGTEEGQFHGVLDHVVAEGTAYEHATELATTIANNSSVAVQGSKEMIRRVMSGTTVGGEAEMEISLDAIAQPDFAEGVRAFLEKRSPSF